MKKALSDEELMIRCRQGDTASFDILFKKYQNAVISFVFRMTGDIEAQKTYFRRLS